MAGTSDIGGVLTRLRTDMRGNVMAMTAAALIPLAGMIGGAFDMSRTYLVKSRLQQACDASVLAYRRSMDGTQILASTEPTARRFFNANFSPGLYGSTNTSMAFSVNAQTVVHGVAGSTVPTTVMKILGVQKVDLSVTCDAQLQLSNSDVMFVLDNTLSMNCDPDGSNCSGGTTSKIASLRTAVQNFHTTLQNAKAGGIQIRYGFVPYASTVNVGMLLKRDWMSDSWTYQSREQNGTTTTTYPGAVEPDTITTNGPTTTTGSYTSSRINGPAEACVAPANTLDATSNTTAWTPDATSLPRSRTVTTTYNGSIYSASVNSAGVCVIDQTQYNNYGTKYTQTVDVNPKAGQTGAPTTSTTYYWNYKPIIYTVSAFKGPSMMAGGSFDTYIGDRFAKKTITWDASNACIEERAPAGGALDDVDMIPNPAFPDTQWHPFLPGLVFARNQTSYPNPSTSGWNYQPTLNTNYNFVALNNFPNDRAACPVAARKLDADLSASTLTSYLKSMTPRGYTYHDIGFLWGLRLMSDKGLFGSENQTAPNGASIARHLIFMTDGQTETNIADYEGYGIGALDRRRTSQAILPTADQQNAVVESRLSTLCTLAKNQKNITVWVIAFGTDLTSLLQSCASPGRVYKANDAAELNQTFLDIASRIAQLRLTR